jgi:hypothetical protein
MYTKAQLRSMRVPKGTSPFSAPQLFAKPRLQRQKARRPATPVARRVDAPVATTSVMRGNSGNTNRVVPLVRREFIGDINGSVAFANTQFSLNPALAATFPWGSQISSSFEEYDTVAISFCYEPESASSATGAIIFSFDYDALDAAPSTKQGALEMADSIRAAPWVPCKLTLKPADLRKRGTLFTRTALVATSDLKTYDLGNLNVSTVGQSGASVIGELWIEYHFVLRTPQPAASSSSSSFAGMKIVANSPAPSGPSFGTTSTITGTAVATTSNNTLTFTVAGDYIIHSHVTGSGSAGITTAIPVTTGSTCTFTVLPPVTCTSTAWTQSSTDIIVSATVGQTLVLDYQTLTLTAHNCRISAYDYTLA